MGNRWEVVIVGSQFLDLAKLKLIEHEELIVDEEEV